MSVTLYEHQHHGVEFLLNHKQAVLGDEMGLGKTLQTIVACEELIKRDEADEVIVVCPLALKLNWHNEILKFTNTPAADIIIVEGSPKTREKLLQLPRRWLLINYEMLRIEGEKLLASQRERRFIMVCDESHRIKNRKAKQAKACVKLGELATRRYLLSGTFIANKPEDIWHQMHFLDEDLAGSYPGFLRLYCITKVMVFGRNRVEQIVGYKNLHWLKEEVGKVMLRRTKDQCLDLPNKVVQKIPVQMTSKQTKLYRQIANALVRSWSPSNRLQRMTYALEAASNPALIQPEVKIAALQAQKKRLNDQQRAQLEFWQDLPTLAAEDGGKLHVLDDLLTLYCQEERRKVILWTFYVGNIKLFSERYRRYNPALFYGQSSDKQRQQSLQRLSDDPDCLLFIANPQAAGVGLNLTQASLCIFFDRNFSSVDYQQAVDRIHRIGQTQACHILLLQAQKSIDCYVDAVHENKIKINDYLQSDAVAKILAGDIESL